MSDRAKQIIGAVVAAVLMFLVGWAAAKAPLHDADFYECPPGNSLHVCKVGTGPPNAACESVGSGKTTIAPRDCT